MKHLERYLFNVIASSFGAIFATLFSITSIVYLVRIAAYTSVIKINFYELFLFYSYMVPNILFYTLPISLFASIAIAFAKLSKEYEMIVISSFGFAPMRFIRLLFIPVLVASLATMVISIGLIPKTNFLSASLLNIKKNEATFNISASEFGQKFGKWMIFIEDDHNKTFHNIRLFKQNENGSNTFVIAKTAQLSNIQGNLALVLHNGKVFSIAPTKADQINFEQMTISDTLSDLELQTFTTVWGYWDNMQDNSKMKKDLTLYILLSLLPLVTLQLVIAIALFNPRYEKNYTVVFVVLYAVCYFISANAVATKFYLDAIVPFVGVWLVIGYAHFWYRVKSVY